MALIDVTMVDEIRGVVEGYTEREARRTVLIIEAAGRATDIGVVETPRNKQTTESTRMNQNISLLGIMTGLVTDLSETMAINVGEFGSRVVRNWLRTARPACHIGQQAVFAFVSRHPVTGDELRRGIFESQDGDSLEVTTSVETISGWTDVLTVVIGGTEGSIMGGVEYLDGLRQHVQDPASLKGLELIIARLRSVMVETV